MKLFDTKLELTALRTICGSDKKLRSRMLASIKDDYFYSEHGKEISQRILKLVQLESEIPTTKELVSDPVLPETTRTVFKKHKDTAESSKEARRIIKKLREYNYARKLHFLSENLNEDLSKDSVDVNKLLNRTIDSVGGIKLGHGDQEEFFHFHKDSGDKLVNRILNKKKINLVPTGFNDFDNTNGGIAYGSLFVIAGPAGGGKTALALQLFQNMTTLGREDCVYIPLEMTEEETSERFLANISKVNIAKIKQEKPDKRTIKKVTKAYEKFKRNLKQDRTKFSIYCPYEGVSMTEALWAVKPFGYRVIFLDYLGLLEGTGGEQQWQAMGEATRQAKIWAKKNNAIVVVLAQSDDKEAVLRYSKVAKDHANNLWTWIMSEQDREDKVMNIKQGKARNQKMFDFTLSFCDDTYRVFNHQEKTVGSDSDSDAKDGSYLEDMSDG